VTEEQDSWLPNLVGGVSIWKLAPDLNEEQFFDGRLLVPDTEGSESLPVRVTWDLTGLVPLPDAREQHEGELKKAVEDFFACLNRTAAVFEKGGSGYDKYKEAFTVPALDADGGAHYFFDPKSKKLCVVNWGASPRKIKHAKEYLFGYQDFGLLIEKAGGSGGGLGLIAGGGAAAAIAAEGGEVAASGEGGEGGEAPAEGEASEEKKDDEKKDDEEKKEEGGLWGKPWWMWALYAVGLLFLIWLAIVLLQDCQHRRDLAAGADGAVAGDVDAGEAPIYGNATDDGGPAATDLHADGAVEDADAGAVDAG